MNRLSRIKGSLLLDNPVAVVLIGLCPAAAVTGRVIDAAWMSLGLILVLILTRLSQGILRFILPPAVDDHERGQRVLQARWLGSLFLASCFTASFEVILFAFAPDESASLGIYVPLIAVNCIVLERFAGSYLGSPPEHVGREIARSVRDAAAVGAGFAIALIALSLVREILGAGSITLFPVGSFSGIIEVGNISSAPARALVYAGGGFLCLGYLAGAARLLSRMGRVSQPQGRPEAERV